jgi:hypothetical protein
MIDKLGIIPAAGKASRFDNIYKEFLPHNQGQTMIQRVASAMYNMDVIQVITNQEKIQFHANHLNKIDNVVFSLQKQNLDIWGAIIESFPLAARHNVFAMPDTCFPSKIIDDVIEDHFSIGYFETEKPERYGVLTENGIVNKTAMPPGKYSAWGVLCWSAAVVDFWLKDIDNIKTYTQAFNRAIDKFGFKLHKMDYYYDFASLKDYTDYMVGNYVK